MSYHHSLIFIFAVALISLASWFVIEKQLARFKIPAIIGYLLVGVVVGPYGINLEGWFDLHVTGSRIAAAYYLSNIALGFLVITSFSDIRNAEKHVDFKASASYITGSICAVILALLTSTVVLKVAPGLTSPGQTTGEESATMLVLALAVAVTSVPFLTKIFIDLRIIGTTFSSTVLVSACLLDILIWAIFPISSVLRTQSQLDLFPVLTRAAVTFAAAAALFFAASYLTQLYDRWAQQHGRTGFGIAFIIAVSLVAALVSAYLGAGLLLGMLIAGLSLGRAKSIAYGSMPPLEKLAKWIFIPAYFILIGRGLVFDSAISIYGIVIFLLWSSALKVTAVTTVHFLVFRDMRQAFTNGVVFNTRGGPGLVLATVAYSMDLINVNAFSAFVAASIVTAPITELLLRFWVNRRLSPAVGNTALGSNFQPSHH